MKITKIQPNTNFGMLKVSAKGARKALLELQEIYGMVADFRYLEGGRAAAKGDLCCFTTGVRPVTGKTIQDGINEIEALGLPELTELAHQSPSAIEKEMRKRLKRAGVGFEIYSNPDNMTEQGIQKYCQSNGWILGQKVSD